MSTKARQKRGEGFDRKRGNEKRYSKAERINGEEARALGDRRLGRSDREDRGKDRPDARGPAHREGKPHQIGAPQADRLGDGTAVLAHQPGDRRQPKKMQTHNDDADAGHDGERAGIGAQYGADDTGAGAKSDEDRGES